MLALVKFLCLTHQHKYSTPNAKFFPVCRKVLCIPMRAVTFTEVAGTSTACKHLPICSQSPVYNTFTTTLVSEMKCAPVFVIRDEQWVYWFTTVCLFALAAS